MKGIWAVAFVAACGGGNPSRHVATPGEGASAGQCGAAVDNVDVVSRQTTAPPQSGHRPPPPAQAAELRQHRVDECVHDFTGVEAVCLAQARTMGQIEECAPDKSL